MCCRDLQLIEFVLFFTALMLFVSQAVRAEDAHVLPAGRSRISFLGAQTAAISENYDQNGKVRRIADPYNLELSSPLMRGVNKQLSQLIDSLNSSGFYYNADQKGNGFGGVTRDPKDTKLGDAMSRGFLNADVEANRSLYYLTVAHGVNDRLTLAAYAPQVTNDIRIRHSITGKNTAQDILGAYDPSVPGPIAPVADALKQIASVDDNKFQEMLQAQGYAPLKDYKATAMGDLVFEARYNYANQRRQSGEWLATTIGSLTAPTGRLKAANNLIEQDFGQGAFDLGAANILNYSPAAWVTLSNGLHFTYPFWSSRDMRVASGPGVLLPGPEDEENVRFRLGNKYLVTLGSEFHLTAAIDLGTELKWAWQDGTTYTGSNSAHSFGYASLGERTDSYSEVLHLYFAASAIPAFFKKDFPIPLKFYLEAFIPLAGRNTPVVPYGTAELALFF